MTRRNPGDDAFRRLERAAAQGDTDARMRLHLERARRGLPLLPDEFGAAAPADSEDRRVVERWFFPNGYGAEVITDNANLYHHFYVLERFATPRSHRKGPNKHWSGAFNVGSVTLGTSEPMRPHEAQVVQDRLRWVMGFKPKGTASNPPDPEDLKRTPDEVARELEREGWPAGMIAWRLRGTFGETPAVRKAVRAVNRRHPPHMPGVSGGSEQGGNMLANPGDSSRRQREREARHDPLMAAQVLRDLERTDTSARHVVERLDGLGESIPPAIVAQFLLDVADRRLDTSSDGATGVKAMIIGPKRYRDWAGSWPLTEVETIVASLNPNIPDMGPFAGRQTLHVQWGDSDVRSHAGLVPPGDFVMAPTLAERQPFVPFLVSSGVGGHSWSFGAPVDVVRVWAAARIAGAR